MSPEGSLEQKLRLFQANPLKGEWVGSLEVRWSWRLGAAAGLSVRLLYGSLPPEELASELQRIFPDPLGSPEGRLALSWGLAWKLVEEKGLDLALRPASSLPPPSGKLTDDFSAAWIGGCTRAYVLGKELVLSGL